MWRFVKKHRETGIEVTLGTWNLLADAEAAASRFGLDCKRYSYRVVLPPIPTEPVGRVRMLR